MRNKRGIAVEQLMFLIVTVLVIVIVVLGLFWFRSGGAGNFFSFIPGFNDTKSIVTDSEVFRYDIGENKVEYYDGVQGVDFETLIVNEKKIDSTDLYWAFRDFFYQERDQPKFSYMYPISILYDDEEDKSYYSKDFLSKISDVKFMASETNIYSSPIIVRGVTSNWYLVTRGEVVSVVRLKTEGDLNNLDFGLFFVDLSNNLYYWQVENTKFWENKYTSLRYTGSGEGSNIGSKIDWVVGAYKNTYPINAEDAPKILGLPDMEDYDKTRDLVDKMIRYRDSILKKPMRLVLEGEFKYYCLEKTSIQDKHYLVVDLSKEVDNDAECY